MSLPISNEPVPHPLFPNLSKDFLRLRVPMWHCFFPLSAPYPPQVVVFGCFFFFKIFGISFRKLYGYYNISMHDSLSALCWIWLNCCVMLWHPAKMEAPVYVLRSSVWNGAGMEQICSAAEPSKHRLELVESSCQLQLIHLIFLGSDMSQLGRWTAQWLVQGIIYW